MIEVGKGKRILLFAKAKSSKSFYTLRARFWEFAKSRADSHFSWEILGFCALRVRFYGIVESARWILDSAELWNRWLIKVFKRGGTLLLAKAKSSKNFYFGCFAHFLFIDGLP